MFFQSILLDCLMCGAWRCSRLMPHGRLVTGAECECLARMCLARPLARNEGLGRGGRPALIPPHTSLTHTSVCTVLHLVVFGESTLVSTMAATSLRSESMQSAAVARSQRCTRLTILLDWHAAHVGGAASCALTSNSFVFLFKSQTRKSQRTSSSSLAASW